MHYVKRSSQGQEEAATDMFNLLSDLTLTVNKGESTRDVPLKVEIIKLNNKGDEKTDGEDGGAGGDGGDGGDGGQSSTVVKTENRFETTDVTSV